MSAARVGLSPARDSLLGPSKVSRQILKSSTQPFSETCIYLNNKQRLPRNFVPSKKVSIHFRPFADLNLKIPPGPPPKIASQAGLPEGRPIAFLPLNSSDNRTPDRIGAGCALPLKPRRSKPRQFRRLLRMASNFSRFQPGTNSVGRGRPRSGMGSAPARAA